MITCINKQGVIKSSSLFCYNSDHNFSLNKIPFLSISLCLISAFYLNSLFLSFLLNCSIKSNMYPVDLLENCFGILQVVSELPILGLECTPLNGNG